jgi:aminopeptidase N
LVSVQEFVSKALTLPGEGEIMDMMQVADPDAVHAVRTFIRKQLALQLKQQFLAAVSLSFLYASYFYPI